MTDRVPGLSANIEGAPTLVYEVWDWCYTSEGRGWRFIGFRTLSLRQCLKYQDFGYWVERSRSRDDRSGTVPLFPRMAATHPNPGFGVDPLPLPEP